MPVIRIRAARFCGAAAGALLLLGASAASASVVLYGSGGRKAVPSGGLFTVGQTNGAATLVGDPAATTNGLSGLAFASPDLLFGSTAEPGQTSQLLQIDPDTGALIVTVGSIGVAIGDLAWDRVTSTLYGLGSNTTGLGGGGVLYTIDTATGAATSVGDTGTGAGGGIAFAPDGTLYEVGFNVGATDFSLNTLDKLTGQVVTQVLIDTFFDGMGIRSDGAMFVTARSALPTVMTITPDGAITALGGGTPISDLDFRPVPEGRLAPVFALGLMFIFYRAPRTAAR